MKIIKISEKKLFQRINIDREGFLESIDKPNIFIVKEMFSGEFVRRFRKSTFKWGLNTEPRWRPLFDNCKDYHRFHDNYPKAFVKQRLHGFYYHSWLDNNAVFDNFIKIFHLKNILGGYDTGCFLKNKPSDGVVARVIVHHYPRGGGYQSEHVDPHHRHSLIQTLIVASDYGIDFTKGGVYIRPNKNRIFLDKYTEVGDMIIMSTKYPHGVEKVDKQHNYSWDINSGRWIIMPIFLFSDYKKFKAVKPKQL